MDPLTSAVQHKRIALSLHRDDDLKHFGLLVGAIISAGLNVYCDLGIADEAQVIADDCRRIGNLSPGDRPARLISHTVYCTCSAKTESRAVEIARIARLSSELRVRAFDGDPGGDMVYNWDPIDFWDVDRVRPEENGASFILKTRDDATAMDLTFSENLAHLILPLA
jgi:hypothetical protein